MKKSLVLAMAIAMGISASAFAANPFSDVPAGHWAYGSIAKLAAAGVIDGYGDGSYRGDRLMTRYEMAQIVARAMAKGANVDRLASEFADELDSLGVRVAKLEKKSDNVKITGQIRYNYANHKLDTAEGSDQVKEYASAADATAEKNGRAHNYESNLRSRIWMTGAVNDNWNYVGMLQNIQDFNNNYGDEGTDFQRAYLEGRLGGTKVTAGRINLTNQVPELYDNRFDGVKVAYGKNVRLGAYYGKPTNEANKAYIAGVASDGYLYNKAWGVNVAGDLGKNATLFAGYDKFTNSDEGKYAFDDEKVSATLDDNAVWNVGFTYNFNDKASLGAAYLKSNLDSGDISNKGVVVTGTIMGAKANKVGSWGINAKYYNQGVGTFVAHTMDPSSWKDFLFEGFSGYMVGANYTVAKNMIAGVEYFDLKGKETDNHDKTLWGQMLVTF